MADIFSRLKYMERRGSGFKKIMADYKEQFEINETKLPVYEADTDDFTLILYNLSYSSNCKNEVKVNGTDIQNDTQGDTQDQLQIKIIKLIKGNPGISTSEIARKLEVSVSTVKRRIKQIGGVEYVGSGYGGYWKIKTKN